MSDQDIKKALDHFTGLSSSKPEKHIEPVLNEWKKMQSMEKAPQDLKDRGWEEILKKKNRLSGKTDLLKNVAVLKRTKLLNLNNVFKLTAAAIVLVVISIVLLNHKQTQKEIHFENAKIVQAKSGVLVNRIIKGEGSVIREGDLLESKGESYRLQISETVILDVQYKSRLRFYSKDGITYVDLREGGLAAVINSAIRPNKLQFITPAGNIIVNGTIFYTRVLSPEETYVCICEGEIELSMKEHSQVVKATHHGAYTMGRKENAEKILPDIMKYHQDPLLEEMAESIHYKFKWKSEH